MTLHKDTHQQNYSVRSRDGDYLWGGVGREGGLMRMAVASLPDVGGSYTISLSQRGPLHSPFIK